MRRSSTRHRKASDAAKARSARRKATTGRVLASSAAGAAEWSTLAAEAIGQGALAPLSQAARGWVERGDDARLLADLRRSLDPDGVPIVWPVSDWLGCLVLLASARRDREAGWPTELDA